MGTNITLLYFLVVCAMKFFCLQTCYLKPGIDTNIDIGTDTDIDPGTDTDIDPGTDTDIDTGIDTDIDYASAVMDGATEAGKEA